MSHVRQKIEAKVPSNCRTVYRTDGGPTSVDGVFHEAEVSGMNRGNPVAVTLPRASHGNRSVFAGVGDPHLTAGSPCIDAGDPAEVPGFLTFDVDGEPRRQGPRPCRRADPGGADEAPAP